MIFVALNFTHFAFSRLKAAPTWLYSKINVAVRCQCQKLKRCLQRQRFSLMSLRPLQHEVSPGISRI
jgi:hypothetical protein